MENRQEISLERKIMSRRSILFIIIVLSFIAGIVFWFREPIIELTVGFYNVISDRERIKTYIVSFGMGAPFIFIFFQVLQVMFAPIPGEATGFIGGFLFGATNGFIYSSIGLTVGSWINFLIGRFLGKRYIRKLIPAKKLERFDTLLKRQGVIILFILFVFPGFPKDYLCLFLGMSALPLKVFMILTAFGRMPGTYMLSLQGASLFDKNYVVFAIIGAVCVLAAIFAYIYREGLYQWIEKYNRQS
jgi:uncharacterized membrane protein YdjX (TVP38/TMEM64 family)